MYRIEQRLGADLTVDELKQIDTYRKEYFQSSSLLHQSDRALFGDHIFILLREDDQLVASSRLIPTTVEWRGQPYAILGIGTVMAFGKGKGYGSRLLTGLRTLSLQDQRTQIGFCGRTNTHFYARNGFRIIPELADRFVQRKEDGTVAPGDSGDVLGINGADGLLLSIRGAAPGEQVYLTRPQW